MASQLKGKYSTHHNQLRILSERLDSEPHPLVRQLGAKVPRHVIVLITIQLTLKVLERRADFVRHERQKASHERPHDEVVENFRLGRRRHHRNLIDELEIFYFDRRVVVDAKRRKHVLNCCVDGQRVSARLDVVQANDLRH